MVKQKRQKRLKVFPRRSKGNGPQKGIEMSVTFAVEHKKRGERRHVVYVHPCRAVNLQQTRKFTENWENAIIKFLCLSFFTSSYFQRSLIFLFMIFFKYGAHIHLFWCLFLFIIYK